MADPLTIIGKPSRDSGRDAQHLTIQDKPNDRDDDQWFKNITFIEWDGI